LFTDTPLLLEHNEDACLTLEVSNRVAQIRETRDGKKPTVLLVEDNDDFRFYIKDNLKEV
jgi:hypothetical protein